MLWHTFTSVAWSKDMRHFLRSQGSSWKADSTLKKPCKNTQFSIHLQKVHQHTQSLSFPSLHWWIDTARQAVLHNTSHDACTAPHSWRRQTPLPDSVTVHLHNHVQELICCKLHHDTGLTLTDRKQKTLILWGYAYWFEWDLGDIIK